MRNRLCPVCNSNKHEVIFHMRNALLNDFNFSYDIVACNKCNFIFAQNIIDEISLDDYYKTVSKYSVISKEISSIDQLRYNALITCFSDLKLNQNSEILDIGCGNCRFINMLQENNLGVPYGVDPSDEIKPQASLFGLKDNVYQFHFDKIPEEIIRTKDAIVSLAVVEHLSDPKNSFKRIINLMKEGALLFISFPPIHDKTFNIETSEPFGEFSFEHIQFFTDKHLQEMLNFDGLQYLKSEFFELSNGLGEMVAIFKKNKKHHQSIIVNSYEKTKYRDKVMKYLKESQNIFIDIGKRLKNKEIYLYGAGAHTLKLIPYLNDNNCKTLGIFDRNTNLHGQTVDGVVIHPIEKLGEKIEKPLVISSFLSELHIKNQLLNKGYDKVICLYE